jgi:hypothetical protein
MRVHYVVITDGSAGNDGSGATREQMRPIASKATGRGRVLGVKSVTFLGEDRRDARGDAGRVGK